MLEKMDFWLLGRLEKIAHWWQKLTGKNCFWLAKLSTCYFGIISLILVSFDSISVVREKYWQVNFSFLIFYSLLTVVMIIANLSCIRTTENRVSSLQLRGTANPLKHDLYFPRVAVIILLVLVVFMEVLTVLLLRGEVNFSLAFIFKTGLRVSYLVSFIVFVYFLSCDPLPPGTVKIKEWKDKFVNAVKGIFTPALQPNPVPCK